MSQKIHIKLGAHRAEVTGSASLHGIFRITDIDTKRSIQFIDGNLPNLIAGQNFDQDSAEPVSLIIARLYYGTAIDEPIPSCDMEIEIDRDVPEGQQLPFILLTSREYPCSMQKYSQEYIPVRELISDKGEILQQLEESEINRVLRRVFKNKDAVIFIMLSNSNLNPIHEKILHNLLRAAGYKNTYVSHRSNSILRVLPYLEKDFSMICMQPLLDNFKKEMDMELGKGSTLNLIL